MNVSAGREYPQPTFDVTPFRPSYPVPFYTENFNEGFFFSFFNFDLFPLDLRQLVLIITGWCQNMAGVAKVQSVSSANTGCFLSAES